VNRNSIVLKALILARNNKRAEATDERETGSWLARAGGSQVFKRVRKSGKAGRLHGNHPFVRGTAPRDANLVPGETSCRRNHIKMQLYHLMALGC
jgi:hypothetical protein